LQALAGSLGLTSEVEPDAKRALRRGLDLATQANAWLLVTGSLYLIGALRGAVGEAASTPDGTGAPPGFGRAPVGGQAGSH
jgi:dihydrofolate synthase/folylpolyglutamate synthase